MTRALGIGSVVCGVAAIVVALLVGQTTGGLFAAASLLMAFAGALRGRGEGQMPATVLLGLAVGAVGLALALL